MSISKNRKYLQGKYTAKHPDNVICQPIIFINSCMVS